MQLNGGYKIAFIKNYFITKAHLPLKFNQGDAVCQQKTKNQYCYRHQWAAPRLLHI